jgi:hemerythrin superfamily protein
MRNGTFDALELLSSQHDEVDALIAKIEASDGDRKAMLFAELANKLAAHSKVEETYFYPTVMARQTEELLLESTEEHLSIKRALSDMLATDVTDPRFDALLTVLKEQVRHHARDEEEGELFPKVRRLMNAVELQALGGELLARFEALMEREPARGVPAETGAPAPLPKTRAA